MLGALPNAPNCGASLVAVEVASRRHQAGDHLAVTRDSYFLPVLHQIEELSEPVFCLEGANFVPGALSNQLELA